MLVGLTEPLLRTADTLRPRMMGCLVTTRRDKKGRGGQPARTLDWTRQRKSGRRAHVTVDCTGLFRSRQLGPTAGCKLYGCDGPVHILETPLGRLHMQ